MHKICNTSNVTTIDNLQKLAVAYVAFINSVLDNHSSVCCSEDTVASLEFTMIVHIEVQLAAQSMQLQASSNHHWCMLVCNAQKRPGHFERASA